MKLVLRYLLFSSTFLLFLLSPTEARAQLLQGAISGNVTDTSQSAIAGAKVVATDQSTGFSQDAVTSASGAYTFPILPPATYNVTISSPGFQTYTRTGVVVTVQTVTRVDASLTIGAVTENVTVSAQAATLQTDRADVRSELSSNLLNSVPVPIGRNYQMIFNTIPGISQPQNSHSFSANGSRSLAFTVNGGNVNANDTRVDGAGTRNFSATDVILYVPSLDAIDTVNVATNAFDADQSAGGAFISVTVKSGANAVHGSLFETHSNQHLLAYQWTADRTRPKLPFINNQFGGTIGGPIKKDKLFYFATYEGVRVVQANVVQAQVPTAAMKSGNLTASPNPIYDPLTGNATGGGRTPFVGNIIPTNRIDSGVQAMIATGAWPNPNQAGTGAFGLGQDYRCSGCVGNSFARRDQLDAKLSWNPSAKLSMFARIGYNDGIWTNPQIFGQLGGPLISPTNISAGEGGAKVWNNTLSATYVFNSHLLMDAYFGYSRIDMYSHQPFREQNLGSTLLGIPGLSTANLPKNKQLEYGGLPLLSIDGFSSLGPANTYQPQEYADPEKNFTANINWLKGSHNIRGGFDADLQDSAETQYQTSSSGFITNAGGFHFAQGTTTLQGGPAGNDFNAFASFLLGFPQDAGKIYQFQDQYYSKNRSYGLYLRDRWEVTPKLTVTYGARWDFFPFPKRVDTGVEIFNPQTATMSICGTGSIPSDCGITRDRQRFDPRIGIAYRLGSSTVLRAGYSMAIDPIFFMGFTSLGNRNFPYIYAQILPAPNSLSYSTTLRQGIPVLTAPNLSGGAIPVPNLVAVSTYDNDNYVRGYIQTWNFTVEQRVKNWLASAGYVASRAVDPQNNLQMNWSPINGGTAGERLNQLNGRTASTQFIGTLGTNMYDSLQVRVQGHFNSGYQLNMAYTFAKAIGYGTSVSIPQYYDLNRSIQNGDVRHNLSVTGVADLPFGRGKRWAQSGIASHLAGGWQLSAIMATHSGSPFSVTASTATLNAPFSSQVADCIAPPEKVGSIYQWYKPSSFAAVPSAERRFGTCGMNILRGPGLFNVNIGVDRKFRITERFGLDFRTDMFNLGNTPHHSNPSNSVSSGTFMQALGIINTGLEGIEQRSVRFSLRLTW